MRREPLNVIVCGEEEPPFPAPDHLRPFRPTANLAHWDGPRVHDQEACGGGRWVNRKPYF
jgi:hypothetical protein